MRLGYKELGPELVSLEDKRYHMPKIPLIAEENTNDGS
jgi:hypothetical protein